jgi:hypothetical protein
MTDLSQPTAFMRPLLLLARLTYLLSVSQKERGLMKRSISAILKAML